MADCFQMLRTLKNKKGGKRFKKRVKNNKKTYRKTFKQMNCNPAVKGKTVNGSSCLTPEVLVKIKTYYNKNHPDDLIVSTDPREIWDQLKNSLSCEKEKCWMKEIKDPVIMKNLEKISFAPDQPIEWASNPDEWLSNYDIFNVIRQYQDIHTDFVFFGPTTIDFDTKLPERGGQCVENQICNFQLEHYLAKGKTKFGIVFNLDKHTQSGSHWVSLFLDIKDKLILYFDSAGGKVPEEVKSLIHRIQQQSNQLSPALRMDVYNNAGVRHQNGNTECGMYSLFFIITLLIREIPNGKKNMNKKDCLDLFLKKRIPDEVVFDYRDLYFNKS